MAKDYFPRPDVRFHAWRNNFVTRVNGRLSDLRHATGAMPPIYGSRSATHRRLRPLRVAAPENAKLRRGEDNNSWLSPFTPIYWVGQ